MPEFGAHLKPAGVLRRRGDRVDDVLGVGERGAELLEALGDGVDGQVEPRHQDPDPFRVGGALKHDRPPGQQPHPDQEVHESAFGQAKPGGLGVGGGPPL